MASTHSGMSISLATPRQYTPHGGWLIYCECGEPLGDTGDQAEVDAMYAAHVAKTTDATSR